MVWSQPINRVLSTVEDLGPKDVAVNLRRAEVQRLRSTVNHGLEPFDFTPSGSRHDHWRVLEKRGLFGTVLK
jgi:hypothetical protein